VLRDFFARNAELDRVPANGQARTVIGQAAGLADVGGNAGDSGDAFGDVVQSRDPGFHSASWSRRAHISTATACRSLLLSDLHGTAVTVVGSAVHTGDLDRVFAAQQKSRALWPAARTSGNSREPPTMVRVPRQ